jgi:hypothetical protein
VLFPYNIFQLDQEPQYIHQLLKDAVTPDRALILGDRPLEKLRVWDEEPLVKFLVSQVAEIDEDVIKKEANHVSLAALRFLLSYFHGSLNEEVLRGILRSQAAGSPDHYEPFSLLVARIASGQINPNTMRNAIFNGPQCLDLLFSKGTTLTGSYDLHEAAIFGLTTIIPYLLEHGLSVHEKVHKELDMEEWGHHSIIQWYPLHYAVTHRRPEDVRAMLEHGADPWLENSIGRTAFEVGVTQVLVGSGPQRQSLEQKKEDELMYVKWHEELVYVYRALVEHCGLDEGDPKMQRLRQRFERVEENNLRSQREQVSKNNYG